MKTTSTFFFNKICSVLQYIRWIGKIRKNEFFHLNTSENILFFIKLCEELNMPSYVKQHYVPQFYLKNFSKNKININCLDKLDLKCYSSKISNIAQGKKFYETEKKNIETDLSKIESQASKDIGKLLRDKDYKLLEDHKYKLRLTAYIYTQLIRTPSMIKEISNQISNINNIIKLNNAIYKFNMDIDELEIKELQLELIENMDVDIFKLIFTKKWVFLKNKTKLNFWTSDNPVVMCNKHGPLGLDSDHIHIFFPLSQKYCLCLIDPFYYKNFMEPKEFNDCKSIVNNAKTPKYSKITKENVIKKINSLQIKYSSRAVYSIDAEFCDNNKLKPWIKECIDKFNNQHLLKTTEIKTNLEGSVYMTKKL